MFVSYRRADAAGWAGRVFDRLAERFGAESVFQDVDAIAPGEDFAERIAEFIASCEAVVVMIGPAWLAVDGAGGPRRLDDEGDLVRLEIAAAFERGVVVIPVLVDGAVMPAESALPESIRRLGRVNAIEVSAARFAFDVARLVEAIEGGRSCPACGKQLPGDFPYCPFCAAPLSAAAESTQEARRTVTAVFCEVAGLAPLGERLDPEVFRRVMGRYFDEMRATVERHGGRVDKFVGDAVVAVFGLPQLHEDDALRAVRAAREMHGRLAGLNDSFRAEWGVELEARIGVSTGEVVVGVDGEALLGEVMNTASRLQSAAGPGDVLVSATSERMLRGWVEMEALGPTDLNGTAEPAHAYRVVQIRSIPARVETPLVGRERQLMVLHQALQDAVDAGSSVLVTILAPPGVGKSRLAEAFVGELSARATVLVGQTPSYGDGVTFAPLVEMLTQAAGRPGDAEKVAAALRERMAAEADGASVGDRLAQFLGVGEAIGADASWAVRRLLEVLAGERPLVLVLEDLHWAEPPMLDLTDAIVERVRGPALFLCLARPELLEQRPTWAAGKPRALTTTLPPLSPEEARWMAAHLLGHQTPASVVDQVCETAEGNPLYLEQLTAMLADEGLIVEGRWVGSDDAAVEIPATLQALLSARLDRLDATPRLILERASVEGRRFRVAALCALTPEESPEEVEAAIASLERKGLVQPEDEASGRWRFAHALVLEAVYRGISKELRADLHERLADWMMEEDADQADADESVARHLERALQLREELGVRDERSAVLSERAGELFAAAGSRAYAAVDYITSGDLLGRAAALLPEGSPKRFDLLPNLGAALADSGKTEEADALLTEAVEQANARGAERDALRLRVQLLVNRIYRSPTEDAIESAAGEARAAAHAFEGLGDEVGLAEAALAISYLGETRGSIAEARMWVADAFRHALAVGHPREAAQAAGDLLGFAISGPLPYGRFEADAEELLSLGDPIAGSVGHAMMAAAALAAGDDAGFRGHEERWRDVLDRHGLPWLAATHGLWIASVETTVGMPEAAERRLREAREFLAPLGNVWWMRLVDGFLCYAVGAQDRPREFLRLADAFAASVRLTDRGTLIDRQLLLARTQLIRGSAADAEAAARRAIELLQPTDLVAQRVAALLVLADILDARGRGGDAAGARSEAIANLRAKGNLAAIATLGGQAAPS